MLKLRAAGVALTMPTSVDRRQEVTESKERHRTCCRFRCRRSKPQKRLKAARLKPLPVEKMVKWRDIVNGNDTAAWGDYQANVQSLCFRGSNAMQVSMGSSHRPDKLGASAAATRLGTRRSLELKTMGPAASSRSPSSSRPVKLQPSDARHTLKKKASQRRKPEPYPPHSNSSTRSFMMDISESVGPPGLIEPHSAPGFV